MFFVHPTMKTTTPTNRTTTTSLRVDDVIHGDVRLSPLCTAFARHPLFARLRGIQQLGTVSRVFPSATHTRWAHSVGTCHLASQLLQALVRSGARIAAWERDGVELAALCHDVGHGPFSHVLDRCVRPLLAEHEERSQVLLRRMYADLQHVPCVRAALPPDKLAWVVDLIDPADGDAAAPDPRAFLREIVSNTRCGIDVDKLDYLLRDQWMLLRQDELQRPVAAMLQRCRVDARGHLAFAIADAGCLRRLLELRLHMHERYCLHADVEASAQRRGRAMTDMLRSHDDDDDQKINWIARVAALTEQEVEDVVRSGATHDGWISHLEHHGTSSATTSLAHMQRQSPQQMLPRVPFYDDDDDVSSMLTPSLRPRSQIC